MDRITKSAYPSTPPGSWGSVYLMTLLFFLACETTAPAPAIQPEVPKRRVSLNSVSPSLQGVTEAPLSEVPKEQSRVDSKCKVDIDMRSVSIEREFTQDGVKGRWDRLTAEPLIMKDPSRGCPILVPAKLIIDVPEDLGCVEAEVNLNVGCGGQCSHARSLKGGKTVQKWTNSVNIQENLVLTGSMDSIELWGEGLEICRIQLR